MRRTPLLRLYGLATRILLPVFARSERRKVTQHGFSADRAAEKLGHPSKPRPAGPLLWVHAASIGEVQSVLALITQLGLDQPNLSFLVTSGTPTSAEVLAQRLPPRTSHQFAPLDAPGPVRRFLDHWNPNAGLFVESELWPNMLMLAARRSLPLALINARMSEASLSRWQAWHATARSLLASFAFIRTQTDALATALGKLAPDTVDVAMGDSLKSLAAPLPEEPDLRAFMSHALGTCPVWVAASTHEGEDEIVLEAHAALLRDVPDLCLILAPRHPERADDIARQIIAQGWPAPRRSREDPPSGPLYLADTLGEMGTWYGLAQFVVLGGSFAPKGGHNPYEVVRAGVPLVTGPDVRNCADDMTILEDHGAAFRVASPEALLGLLQKWFKDPNALAQARNAAQTLALGSDTALAALSQDLRAVLRLDGSHG